MLHNNKTETNFLQITNVLSPMEIKEFQITADAWEMRNYLFVVEMSLILA